MKEEFLKETHGKKEAVRGAGFHLTPYNEKAGRHLTLTNMDRLNQKIVVEDRFTKKQACPYLSWVVAGGSFSLLSLRAKTVEVENKQLFGSPSRASALELGCMETPYLMRRGRESVDTD